MKVLILILLLSFWSLVSSSKSTFEHLLKKSKSSSCTSGFDANSFIPVYLIADTGKAIARCYKCGSASNTDSAAVHGNIGDSFAKWKMYPGCDGTVALQGDNNKYLARCHDCWTKAINPDAAFVHATDPNQAYAHWNLINNRDGTYSFKSDTGKYLARCNGCVTGGSKPDFAFVHATDNSQAYAKWKIQLA